MSELLALFASDHGVMGSSMGEGEVCLNLNSASLHRTFHDRPSVIVMTEMLLKTELQIGGGIQDNSKIIFPNFLTETYVVTPH